MPDFLGSGKLDNFSYPLSLCLKDISVLVSVVGFVFSRRLVWCFGTPEFLWSLCWIL